MAMKISTVDHFLTSGCGRCKYFDTPQCKVHTWTQNSNYLEDLLWIAA